MNTSRRYDVSKIFENTGAFNDIDRLPGLRLLELGGRISLLLEKVLNAKITKNHE